jgi:hypothetical protein
MMMHHPVHSISSWSDRLTCFEGTKHNDTIHLTPHHLTPAVREENDQNKPQLMEYIQEKKDSLGTWQSIGRTYIIQE